jgi:hypothetical protein
VSKEMNTIVAVAVASIAVRLLLAYYPAAWKYF